MVSFGLSWASLVDTFRHKLLEEGVRKKPARGGLNGDPDFTQGERGGVSMHESKELSRAV